MDSIQVGAHKEFYYELRQAYDRAVQRFPDRIESIDVVFEVVEDLRTCLMMLDGVLSSEQAFSEFDYERTDSLYSLLHHHWWKLESISDHSKALFTWREHPVTWRSKTGCNVVDIIRDEALRYRKTLQEFSRHNTFAPSEQLREIHPELWFDCTGLQAAKEKLLSVLKVEKPPAGVEAVSDEPPYLGLRFHPGSKISRDGYTESIDITAPQHHRILRFIHEAGERGRTDFEMSSEGLFDSLKQEKNKIKIALIPLNVDFESRQHRLIHKNRSQG